MTLEFEGMILIVEGEYQPYEREELEYPGYPEGYYITSIKDVDGEEIDVEDMDGLEDLALETYKGNAEEAQIENYLDHKDD